jgi:Ca2+-transporting ATPase
MNLATQTRWHDKAVDELVVPLATDVQHGLSSQEAAEHLEKAGRNALRTGEAVSPLAILVNQFRSLVIWVLIGAVSARSGKAE